MKTPPVAEDIFIIWVIQHVVNKIHFLMYFKVWFIILLLCKIIPVLHIVFSFLISAPSMSEIRFSWTVSMLTPTLIDWIQQRSWIKSWAPVNIFGLTEKSPLFIEYLLKSAEAFFLSGAWKLQRKRNWEIHFGKNCVRMLCGSQRVSEAFQLRI